MASNRKHNFCRLVDSIVNISTMQQPLGSGFDRHSTAEQVMAGVDLSGQTAVVTGGYSGLGLESVRALVRAGARVVVPARDLARAESALEGLTDSSGGPVTVVSMDLADLDSVRAAGLAITEIAPSIDLVIAAAGVMATPLRRLDSGREGQLAVNHLGHYALIGSLMPALRQHGGARVVVYSSAGHFMSPIRWSDPDFREDYDKWAAYGQSKTANALFAVHLDALFANAGIRAFSVHPGSIPTDLMRYLPAEELQGLGWVDEDGQSDDPSFKTVSQGAATGLWAATSSQLSGLGGLYCEDCDVAVRADGHPDRTHSPGVRDYAIDFDEAARLWQWSESVTAVDSGGK